MPPAFKAFAIEFARLMVKLLLKRIIEDVDHTLQSQRNYEVAVIIDVKNLILKLEQSTGADRGIDFKLARLCGWSVESVVDEAGKSRDLWLAPGTSAPGKVPRFTSYLDAARSLADRVLPDQVAAITIDGACRATVNDGPTVEGANPALALCLAVLKTAIKDQ
jgi:hypothetical protein